jgi:hydroxymethylpyrimidine/phosphomethylpyrimidine kinase
MRPVALSIAGSDPSGGAGIQADLKTFHQFGVYGEAVITLITVQNTTRVDRVHCLPATLVMEQLASVLEDIPPAAAKSGALGSREIVELLGRAATKFEFPLVVDPVMVAKHGSTLISGDARSALRTELIPSAYLLTPNLEEASDLTGIEIHDVSAMREAAQRLCRMGARSVLIKGGHLNDSATDVLFSGGAWREFRAPRIATSNTHGTGCTYSAAIVAELAKGIALAEAVACAKVFITEAIRSNPGLGHGCGPINHHAEIEESKNEVSGPVASGH